MMGDRQHNQRGAALPVVILATLVIMTLSGVLVTALTNEIRVRQATEARVTAKYVAEAGIEWGISGLYTTLDKVLQAEFNPDLHDLEATYVEPILVDPAVPYPIELDGEPFGEYQLSFPDEAGNELSYHYQYFAPTDTYKAVPKKSRFKIRAEGKQASASSGKMFIIEAEVEFGFQIPPSAEESSIEQVHILAWQEVYD